MIFYHNIIKSFAEMENCSSMILHSLVGCNLKCFGCHNYKELIETTHEKYCDEGEILEIIRRDGFLFDCIIFSGGEFLMSSLENVVDFLTKVREMYKGLIIVNTNGSYPDKLRVLFDKNLIDGSHVDMKLPYHLLDVKEDSDIFEMIIGCRPSEVLIKKFLESIDISLSCGKVSKVRTVRYPVLDDSYFEEIEKYIEDRKKELGSNVEYKVNDFVRL